jgi:hypothetical protein
LDIISRRTEPPDGPGSAAEGVCAFLAGLGIGRTSAIHLVGRGALAPLLWLCRHGFDEVTALSGVRSPSEPADLLVSLDTCGTAAFEQLAGDLPHVKPGGLVIVRTDRRRRTDRQRASRLLGRDGFRIERRLRQGRRDVYVARREILAATSAAAGRRNRSV